MNSGIYLDELENTSPSDFCIGVAGYPEKHIESPNIQDDLDRLKKKVDSGADYIVTQMFFDNEKFYSFRDRCKNAGINVPIIPGIKPIAASNDINLLPQTFNIDLPAELTGELKKCRSNDEAREVGIEWSVLQSKDLLSNGVSGIHYYTLGSSDNIARIVKQVF